METKKWKKQRQRHEHAQYNNKICNLIAQHICFSVRVECARVCMRCMYRFHFDIIFLQLRIAINSMTSATGPTLHHAHQTQSLSLFNYPQPKHNGIIPSTVSYRTSSFLLLIK